MDNKKALKKYRKERRRHWLFSHQENSKYSWGMGEQTFNMIGEEDPRSLYLPKTLWKK